MEYTQELEVAIRELLMDVVGKYPEIKQQGFKCPYMQRLADLIDLALLPDPIPVKEGT